MKIDIYIEADPKEIASLLPQTKDWHMDYEEIATALGKRMVEELQRDFSTNSLDSTAKSNSFV